MIPATAETWEGGGRPAWPHELCTCGRPAEVVYRTQRGDIGYCAADVAAEPRRPGSLHQIGSVNIEDNPVLPCPFCGADEPHLVVCPDYRVRPGGGS